MGNEYLWHTYDQAFGRYFGDGKTVLHISQLLYNKKTCQEEVAHKIKFYNEFVFVFCGCSSWVKHQEKISWFQPIVWCQWYPIHLSIMSIFSIQFYPVWLPWYELYFHFLDLKRSYQKRIIADVKDFNSLGKAIDDGKLDGDAWVNFFIDFRDAELELNL